MNKQERQLLQSQLETLESKISDNNLSSLSGDYFETAIALTEIKENKLYKCLKKDNKLVYRTFSSYISHFNWEKSQCSLINYLMSLYENLVSANVPLTKMAFPTDVTFWKEFKKIKKEYIAPALDFLYENSSTQKYTVEDVKMLFKEHEDWKVGFGSAPSALKTIIGNINRVTSRELETYKFETGNESNADEIGNKACILSEVCNAMMTHANLPLQFAAVNLDLYNKVDKVVPVSIKEKSGMVALAEVGNTFVIDKTTFKRAIAACVGIGLAIGASIPLLIKAFF